MNFMLEKIEILFVIFGLLFLFYFVISLSARQKNKIEKSNEILKYLRNVRILIIILLIVGLVLWLIGFLS
tara:strand:+ start:332 stop:541 length:210 start_codon:yes stop_codon:yes gene_type:complete